MKELSIEEKARAYDEALKKASDLHRFSSNPQEIKRMEEIFPELRESEDERIRKEILDYIIEYSKSYYDVQKYGKEKFEKWIAWLEKQGEQKPTWSEEDEEMFRSLHNLIYVVRDCDCDSKKKKEYSDWLESLKYKVKPKQEWNKEDEKCIRLSTDIIDSALRAGFCVQLDRDRCVDWLKSLKDKMQPKQE